MAGVSRGLQFTIHHSLYNFLPISVRAKLTCLPAPNFRVSQSSRSTLRACRSTPKPTSIKPSATGRLSSKAERPVKLRIKKLSSQAMGQARGPCGLNNCTWILRANTKSCPLLPGACLPAPISPIPSATYRSRKKTSRASAFFCLARWVEGEGAWACR